ncbi:BrnT family toxin [Blastomonas sp.]|uniref:BrnT family toxin n=1 Tax=Blastomonas sp. TaxID=1909299 RepID=UPI0035940CBB
MQFEFDPAKSALNKRKHGIDFAEAQALWEDDDAMIISARSESEERIALVGRIGSRIWVAFVTMRSGVYRIISVRRARKYEVEDYERQIGNS